MYLYGGIPKPLSFGILILFSLYLGLYHAAFGALLVWFRRITSPEAALLVAPFLWVSIEMARSRITGFPWDLLGYAQVDNLSLIKLAPWTGVMGLSFLIAAVNAIWLFPMLSKQKRLSLISCAAAFVFVSWTIVSSHSVNWKEASPGSAVLLQENLGVGTEEANSQESKDQMLRAFSWLSEHPTQGTSTSPQLIIWPEAPTSFVDTDPILRQAMSKLAQDMKAPVIVNDVSFAERNPNGRYDLYNSASFYRPSGSYAGRYDKMHLVPFGEYTPYKPLFFFVGHLLDDLPFIPGTKRTVFDVDGGHYGVFICYESIFGDEIREFAKNGAQVLVNISDDGWYGDTSAPWEHLDMARMRAIENHRWLLRATNTGITTVINPLGQTMETLPRHTRGALVAHFAYENDLTFYTRYGDWFAWSSVAIVVLALAVGEGRARFMRPEDVH